MIFDTIFEWVFDRVLGFDPPPLIDDSDDAELREIASTMLKRHAICLNTSRRHVIDLVDMFGIKPIRVSPPDVVLNLEPAILVVLDGPVLITSHISTNNPTTRELQPGVYLRSDPVIAVVEWNDSMISAYPDGPLLVHVCVIDAPKFVVLPKIILNAFNPGAASDIWSAI